MFKRTLQQKQWFKDSAYIKYSKKSYFIKEYSTAQKKLLGFKNKAQSKNILEDNN
jgi:Mg2+/Co2+ transporter CorB